MGWGQYAFVTGIKWSAPYIAEVGTRNIPYSEYPVRKNAWSHHLELSDIDSSAYEPNSSKHCA